MAARRQGGSVAAVRNRAGRRSARRVGRKPISHRELEIGAVGHLVVALVVGELVVPEAAIVDVALRADRGWAAPLPIVGAVLAAPAGERADARRALVVTM